VAPQLTHPQALYDPIASPNVKTTEGEGVGAPSLTHSTSRVKGRVAAPRWN
jgi:hypothetical protein